MTGHRLRSITDVVERHLCSGCGTCAYLQPNDLRMVDTHDQGRRPLPLVAIDGMPADTAEALASCPGARLEHQDDLPETHLEELGNTWGPVLEVWEGWASDEEIRYRGSSGGAVTALALHCLEVEGMAGTLQTAARRDVPYLNETVLSRDRGQLLRSAGSRYAPSSPCEGLDLIESADAPCVFIGKPCDVAGATAAARFRPTLHRRLGLTIGVFCAGTPSTAGTLEAIRTLGVNPDEVATVRYRGHGWPGTFGVGTQDGQERGLSYEESWGAILQRHRHWRCMICPDHTGEFADISVGDPWYRPIEPGEPGRSLILVRTERGRTVLHAALAAGHLQAQPVDATIVPRSQPNLVRTRGAVWGRLLAMRASGLPTPVFSRLPMFAAWWRLPPRERIMSVAGTLRRIRSRRLYRRDPIRPAPGWGERPSRS